MFIKNQVFEDEETLLEMLFDFSFGQAAPLIEEMREVIEKDLAGNEAYQNYLSSLTDEEDKLELETEERYIRLAETLREQFDSFKVKQQSLYGTKNGEDLLLYSIDLD
jgi:hypothetical protein